MALTNTMKVDRPFRLGTTSFIVPDHILPNLELTGPVFDEIELLVFECQPWEWVPSAEDVSRMAELGKKLNLTYNIHLPVDIRLTHENKSEQQKAADLLSRVMDRFAILNPTAYTLHLEKQANEDTAPWTQRALDGMALLAQQQKNLKGLALETLNYDPMLLAPVLSAYPELGITLDMGHFFKYGFDLNPFVGTYRDRIPLIHLHGVDVTKVPPQDHIGLDRLPGRNFSQVTQLLSRFNGTVCLEVFNLDNLNRSLETLASVFNHISKPLAISS